MKLYMTSSIGGNYKDETGRRIPCPMDSSNGMVESLKTDIPKASRGLLIASDPKAIEMNNEMASIFIEAFHLSEIEIEDIVCLDKRNDSEAEILIRESDFIILAGGHVPTQNNFFHKIHLKSLLKTYDGIVIGISAGSMNCGKIVYAQPELQGDAIDPEYCRFLPGLELSNISILPHFQYIKTISVDGLRTVEDMTIPDSHYHPIFCINDGTYIVCENGKQTIYGEACRFFMGEMQMICENNQKLEI